MKLNITQTNKKKFTTIQNIEEYDMIGIGIGLSFKKGGVSSSYWLTRYPSGLTLTVDSDTQITINWTNNGLVDYDNSCVERGTDGINFSLIASPLLGLTTYVNIGLTAGTSYYYRICFKKGTHYSAYSNIENARTFGVAYAVLDTIADGKYNIMSSLAQSKTDENIIIETYLQGVSPNYDATKILRMRVSTDKGRTFGTASTIYAPGGVLCVQEQHSGFTSDGRFHILCTLLDNVAACSLIYLYSDNNGTSFITVDISALVSDATYVTYRNSGQLKENNGVLLSAFYSLNAAVNSWRRLCLRLVAGTWTKITVETTIVNETESSIEIISGDNLIMLTRQDDALLVNSFVQYISADNGLTWTRLGTTILGLEVHQFALPGQLNRFKMNGEDIIVMYYSQNAAPLWCIYAIYARATDILELGIGGWNYNTLKKIKEAPGGLITRVFHGNTIHYDNNYNALGCWCNIRTDYSFANIDIFDVDTTDFATLRGYLFPTYTADVDSNAFNAVNATNPTAIINLIGGLKQYSLYAKIKTAYPMLGDTATLHQYNLVNPVDSDAAFRLHFVADHAANHTFNGYAPNGIDQYADTHLNPSTQLTLYSVSLGYYSRTNVSEAGIDMGAYHALGTTNPCCMLRVRYTDGKGRMYAYNGFSAADAALTAVISDSRRFTMGSRTANNVNKAFINGVQSGLTVTAVALNVTANFTIYIGANNADGTAASFTAKECAFAIIADGYTVIEAHNLNRVIHYFQKTLSRNI